MHKDGSEKGKTTDKLFEDVPYFFGRPTIYSVAIVNKICTLLSLGYSLNKICSFSDMPCITTVFDWLNDKTKADFADKYAYARKIQNDVIEDGIRDIPKNVSRPYVYQGEVIKDDNGKTIMIVDSAMVSLAKLDADIRTRHMEVVKPKKWGRNIDLGEGVGGLLALMDDAAKRVADYKKEEAAIIDGETGKVVES